MTASSEFHYFVDLLEANAQRFGDKAAVHFLADGRAISDTVTFGQLHERAQTFASTLQHRYVPQARVLLMLPTGIDYVQTFCACLYADLIAVPMFPPPSRKPRHLDRVRNVVADAAPSLILCEAPMHEVLRELVDALHIETDILTVEDLRLAQPAAASWQRPASDGNAVAFLQYTSGSTGTPKGVMVRHRNLLANLELMRHAYGFDEQDRMVNWLPLYHDMGLIGGLLEPIYSGMTCYLMSSQTFVKAPWLWLQALSQYRGTASFAPNFAYGLCNRTVDDDMIRQFDLRHWAHAINGAEPIHASTMSEFCERFAVAGFRPEALSPGYGQAEATLCVSATPRAALPVTVRIDKAALQEGRVVLTDKAADAAEFVACGYPQPGHRVAIVHPQTFAHCAENEIGEIWLSGPSNADTYWQKPEASQHTFHAHATGDDTRYLRSGDLGFFYQGQLVVCGRLKDLIILNGRNLYPNDIEFAITNTEPGIRAGRIAAFSVTDVYHGREKLVVVAEPHRKFVDAAHHAKLFAGMQQAVHEAADCAIDCIVLIEAGTIPMTTSGKISRSSARQQYLNNTLSMIATSAASAVEASEEMPVTADMLRTHVAKGNDVLALCLTYLGQCIRRLRPDARIDADASLIALGLDSISISALHGMLRMELGWSPLLVQLFGDRTLAALAAALQQQLTQPASDVSMAIVACKERRIARQSYAQRRLWFLNQLDPKSCQHNIAVRIGLRGALDIPALERSLLALVARHAVLHTRYRNGTQGAEQIIEPVFAPSLHQYDFSPLPADIQRQYLANQLHNERHKPFDLQHGQVLRAHLTTCGPDSYTLLLGLHHIAFDGRSAEIFLDELSRFYETFCQGRTPSLPDLALQYSDFAEWENERFTPTYIEETLRFWRSYLHDMPHTITFTGEPAVVSGPSAVQYRFALRHAQYSHFEQFCRNHNLTLFMGLLTLYSLVVYMQSGQTRFIVGTDVAGRTHPQLDGLIGFFINQLPIRCDLSGDPSLRVLFERLGTDAQQAYAHQEMPFDVLVSALAPQRSSSQTPLFQVKLNYQKDRTGDFALGDVRVEEFLIEQDIAGFDLVLDLTHGLESIAANLKYNTQIFSAGDAVRIQHLLEKLLSGCDALLDQPLSVIRRQMQDWDTALQLELQKTQTAHSRAQLAFVKRRAVSA